MKKIQINKIRCIFAASLVVVTAVFLNGCGILLEDRTFALSLSVDYKEGEYLVWYGISDLYDEVSEKEESGAAGKTIRRPFQHAFTEKSTPDPPH